VRCWYAEVLQCPEVQRCREVLQRNAERGRGAGGAGGTGVGVGIVADVQIMCRCLGAEV